MKPRAWDPLGLQLPAILLLVVTFTGCPSGVLPQETATRDVSPDQSRYRPELRSEPPAELLTEGPVGREAPREKRAVPDAGGPDLAVPDKLPSWVPNRKGPWREKLVLAFSSDGQTFQATGRTVALWTSTPSMAVDKRGRLFVIYQYFSHVRREEFDRTAVSYSDDLGKSWSGPRLIDVRSGSRSARGNDPHLVLLADGRLRLYLTSTIPGHRQMLTISAVSTDGFNYTVEAGYRFKASSRLLDPTVVKHSGVWHYYAVSDVMNDWAYHATSANGLDFRAAGKVSLKGVALPGNALSFTDGIRYFAGGPGGVASLLSKDGSTFTLEPGTRLRHGGGDPGVVRLPDGRHAMVTVLPINASP